MWIKIQMLPIKNKQIIMQNKTEYFMFCSQVLRHDKALHTVKHQPQLRNVPDYIVPQSLKKMSIPSSNANNGGKRHKFNHNKVSKAKRKFEKNQADPLKALVSKGKRNNKR